MSKIKLGGSSSKSAEAPATTSTQHHIRRANSDEPPSGNFLLAFLVGALAAAACAYAWGILARQQIPIGYLAVGTGLLLGLAIRIFGQGSQSVYGMTGVTLTLVACVAGNLVTMCMIEGQEQNVDWLALFRNLKIQPVLDWWKPRFQPVHAVFYIGALVIAHRLAYKHTA